MNAMSPDPDYWVKRAKWLTQALLISGTLNVGFFSTFFYLSLRDRYRPLHLELKPMVPQMRASHIGLQELLIQYQSLSFEELLEGLSSSEHVEAGYTKRDLNLAALVAFHHFNLERALGGLSLQRRLITFRNPKTLEQLELTIFPALADYQYQAIIQYAKTEKWPFNSYGLFLALKNTHPFYDPSLLEAFSLTPQFHFIHTLFSKTGYPLSKQQIISLLAGGNWKLLQETSELLRVHHAFDPLRRREFLVRLLGERSQLAAALLLQTDFAFVYKQLDDAQMLAFLNLLGLKTPVLFAKALLLCPRSDAIWKRASSILYAQLGESSPEPYDHFATLNRFVYNHPLSKNIPQNGIRGTACNQTTELQNKIKPRKKLETHIVQTGDTLYQIARMHKVSVESLRRWNDITGDQLYPGQKLTIFELQEISSFKK